MSSWWEAALNVPGGTSTEILPHTIFHSREATQAFINRLAQSVFDIAGTENQEVKADGQVYFTGTSNQVDTWLSLLFPMECYDEDSMTELPIHRHLSNRPNWPPIPSGGAAPGTENLPV